MVSLFIDRNFVILNKKDRDYKKFVNSFLVKYENVAKTDKYKVSGKKIRYVKERRELYTDFKDFIIFARGILDYIPLSEYRAFSQKHERSLVVPNLTFEEIKKTLPTFDLRDDQIVAVNKCLLVKRGVIQLPTAVGKSAIIASTIKRLIEVNPDMKALVIAPTLSILSGINNTLVNNGIDSKIYGHPDKDFSTSVTAALVQSLVDESDDNLLADINAVFYDECLPAKSMILLPDGTQKRIIDIYEDDNIQEVLSYNTVENKYEVKKIVHKYKTPYNQKFCKVYYYDYLLREDRSLTCTPNHKIFTTRGYIPAEFLKEGDLVKIYYPTLRDTMMDKYYGYCKIKSVILNRGGNAPYKYNLEVEDNHNYFADSVLVSNCHHLKCDTWNSLNFKLPNVEYALGFSALSIDKKEIFERDFRNLSYDASLIVGSAGKVLMHMDPSYYIEKGIIAMPVIFRIENHIKLPIDFDESNWHNLVNIGLQSSIRTYKVAKSAEMFSRYNRKILILVSEKDHAYRIGEYLFKLGVTNYGISFGAGQGYVYDSSHKDENEEIIIDYKKINTLDVLNQLSNGKLNIVIGTSHIDEGVDIDSLDSIILACGGKKDRKVIQRVGRVLRKSKTGKYAYIIDFDDEGSKVLSRQSESRLKMYRKDIGIPEKNIFNHIPMSEIENKFKELESLN